MTFVELHARCRKITNFPPGPSLFTIIRNSIELYKNAHQDRPSNHHHNLFAKRTQRDSPNPRHIILRQNKPRHNRYSLIFLPVSPLWQELRNICHGHLFSTKTIDI
ncbi:hypothetical protein HKD37_10G029210 [Glycine soja]